MTIDLMLRSAREAAYRVLDTVVVWLEVDVFDPLNRRFPQADWKYVTLFALLLFPFFEPEGLRYAISPAVGKLYLVLRLAATVVIGLIYVFCARKDRFSLIAFAIAVLMFASTVVNEGNGRAWIYIQCFCDWSPLMAAVLLVAYARKEHMIELLWAIMIVTGVLSVCNTISVMGWPDGIAVGSREPTNFFGHKNASIDLILPSVGCSLLLDTSRKRRFSVRSATFLVIGFVQCVLTYSATSVVALVVFLALVAAVQFQRARSFVNGLSCLAAYLLATALLVWVKVQELLAPLIVGGLGKSVTFTGRTFVWDGVLSIMDSSHLLVGYGASLRFGLVFNDYLYNNAHNFILHVLVSGGLLGVVLYGALLLMAAVALYRHRHKYSTGVLVAVVGCFLVVGLMESLITVSWPLFLALAYYWGSSKGSMLDDCS